jgi:biotin synthase
MGESEEELVDVAFNLRQLRPDSVPVNFLMPFEGTPMAGRSDLTPAQCLRVLAMFRFVFPDVEVRIAGGREMHLRSLQPLGLHIANSIFLGDYLTSEGAPGSSDLQMIADAGFVVEGADEATLPRGRLSETALNGPGERTQDGPGDGPGDGVDGFAGAGKSHGTSDSGKPEPSIVPVLRQRGPGTQLPANA